jgi:2,3-dihydroxyphenylpropionate 1,2-dioxygenase
MTPVVSSPPRNVRLICASHSPMMEFIHPDPAVEQAARGAFADLAREVADYDPQLIVLFAPDHFNGFFYDLMPPFCLGIRARGAGDWDYSTDPLDVPEDVALDLVRFVQDQGVDLAYSYRMQADHGFTQPLALLAGDVARYPVLPIFVNGAAHPAPPIHRAGAGARGRAVLAQDGRAERVLILGSGGLSHDPPTPQMGKVPPEVEEFLIAGRNPTAEARARRQANVLSKGAALARGEGKGKPCRSTPNGIGG